MTANTSTPPPLRTEVEVFGVATTITQSVISGPVAMRACRGEHMQPKAPPIVVWKTSVCLSCSCYCFCALLLLLLLAFALKYYYLWFVTAFAARHPPRNAMLWAVLKDCLCSANFGRNAFSYVRVRRGCVCVCVCGSIIKHLRCRSWGAVRIKSSARVLAQTSQPNK